MKKHFLSLLLLISGLVACSPQMKAMDAEENTQAVQERTFGNVSREILEQRPLITHSSLAIRTNSLQKIEHLLIELQTLPRTEEEENKLSSLFLDLAHPEIERTKVNLDILKLMFKLNERYPIIEETLKTCFGAAIYHGNTEALNLITSHLSAQKSDNMYMLDRLIKVAKSTEGRLATGLWHNGEAIPEHEKTVLQNYLKRTHRAIKVLLKNSTNPNLPNNENEFPLQLTTNEKIQKLLILYGATPIDQKTQVFKDELAQKYKKEKLQKSISQNNQTIWSLKQTVLPDELQKKVFTYLVLFTLDEQIAYNKRQAQQKNQEIIGRLAQLQRPQSSAPTSHAPQVQTPQAENDEIKRDDQDNVVLPTPTTAASAPLPKDSQHIMPRK